MCPTTKEAGLPEYQVSAWNAVFAPKGTPADITAKLNDALVKALDDENTTQAPARPRRRAAGPGRAAPRPGSRDT